MKMIVFARRKSNRTGANRVGEASIIYRERDLFILFKDKTWKQICSNIR